MRNKGTKTSNVDLNRGMKVVRELDEHKWREFVDNHPEGRIFHTPEMFQVFARTRGHKPRLWAVVDEEDQVMALFTPVEITLLQRLLGRFASFTKRAVSYGSVLCACNMQGRRALALLFQAYVNQPGSRPIFTELRNLSNTGCIQSMICEHGFEYEEHLNYLIDINKPPEAIMQNIGKRTRKNIQRGLRKGIVKVVEARSPEQVEACYELLQKTYKNAQVPLADRSLFETAFQVLHPKGMIRFTLANVDQTPVAGSVELLYKDIVYGWYGGVDREYCKFVPNEMLTWNILKWGSENGYAVYDFGGAGKPDEEYGVRDFKAKFNGKLVNYGRNTIIHAPFKMVLCKFVYEKARNMLGPLQNLMNVPVFNRKPNVS